MLTANVLLLQRVWGKAPLKFRLYPSHKKHKTNYKLSLIPKSVVVAVGSSIYSSFSAFSNGGGGGGGGKILSILLKSNSFLVSISFKCSFVT